MKRGLAVAILSLFFAAPAAGNDPGLHWIANDVEALKRWVRAAPRDALPQLSTASLDAAVVSGVQQSIDEEANLLGIQLARMHLLGRATRSERESWNIVDSDTEIPLGSLLERAVRDNTLNTFFALQRPTHSEYGALRAAYAQETDVARRTAIARNMERWRWMPRNPGNDYVLVNTAHFEAYLWRAGTRANTWRVIIGKQTTPTPVFDAKIEGVTFNPWWEIPASIVRESIGALVRNNPSLARSRGYVWSGGRYRQRPGPNNALGLMKLVMPNRYSVYMHDTPNQKLFDEDVRSFSHGCIRTDDAIGYAAKLLEGVTTSAEIDAIVSSGKTTTVKLAKPIPIFVAYFTAVSDDHGGVVLLPDIYDRDRRIRVESLAESESSDRGNRLAMAAQLPASVACNVPDDPVGLGMLAFQARA